MDTFLYGLIGLIANIHTSILNWNNGIENSFTDKELHFLVIGVVGILLIFVIHPIFKLLAESGHTMVITFFYVFTVLIVVTFAIEIGQRLTGTGNMEFADIEAGIIGFFVMFAAFLIVRGIYHLIVGGISKASKKSKRKRKENPYLS